MTDPNFLEFWGNFLIAVARGQRQLQDLSVWMHQGFQGLEDITAMFKKSYGLESLQPDTPAFQEAWKKATAEYRDAFKETFEQLGWITEEKYRDLRDENQKLHREIEEKNRLIQSLKTLLKKKGLDQSHTLDVFQDLIHKQGEELSFGGLNHGEHNRCGRVGAGIRPPAGPAGPADAGRNQH